MEKLIENFGINPEEEEKRRKKILEMLREDSPRLAEILQKHAPSSSSTTQETQEKVEVAPEEPPKITRNFRTHIELSQQRESDDEQ